MAVIEREAKIVNPLGMHVRPGAEFVKVANRFKCAVEVRNGAKTATLTVKPGATLQVKRLLQIVGRVGVLFQIEFRKAREFPSLSITRIAGCNLLRLFRSGGVLLLLEELICMRCVRRYRSASYRLSRFHVQQRRILVRSGRGLGFGTQQGVGWRRSNPAGTR